MKIRHPSFRSSLFALLFLTIMASTLVVTAQLTATSDLNLSIHVVDELENPLEFATVIVYVDNEAVNAGQTNAIGKIKLDILDSQLPKHAKLKLCVYYMGVRKCYDDLDGPVQKVTLKPPPIFS